MKRLTDSHNMSDLLHLVLDNEILTQELYLSLITLFSHNNIVHEFLSGMADDEKNHIQIVTNILSTLSEKELKQEAAINEWERALSANQTLIDYSFSKINNFDNAYELIHELEFNEINLSLFGLVDQFIEPESMQNEIYNDVLEHQNKIIQFGQIIGNRHQRQQLYPKADSSMK